MTSTVNKDIGAAGLNHICMSCVSNVWADMKCIWVSEYITSTQYILTLLHLWAWSTHYTDWVHHCYVHKWDCERIRQQEAICGHQQSLLGNVYPVGGCQAVTLKVIYFLVAPSLLVLRRRRRWGINHRGHHNHATVLWVSTSTSTSVYLKCTSPRESLYTLKVNKNNNRRDTQYYMWVHTHTPALAHTYTVGLYNNVNITTRLKLVILKIGII